MKPRHNCCGVDEATPPPLPFNDTEADADADTVAMDDELVGPDDTDPDAVTVLPWAENMPDGVTM